MSEPMTYICKHAKPRTECDACEAVVLREELTVCRELLAAAVAELDEAVALLRRAKSQVVTAGDLDYAIARFLAAFDAARASAGKGESK